VVTPPTGRFKCGVCQETVHLVEERVACHCGLIGHKRCLTPSEHPHGQHEHAGMRTR
jgi:hypothetical protein